MGPKKRKSMDSEEPVSTGQQQPISTEVTGQQKPVSTESTGHEEPETLTLPEYLRYGPKFPIPASTVFQAHVPDVTEVLDLQSYRDQTERSKLLGTRVWPLDVLEPIPNPANEPGLGLAEPDPEPVIGRGRPSNCGCRPPGSEDCVRLHISDQRAQLRLELGPAFEAWKFDEMGEAVADSWDPGNARLFKFIVSAGDGFLKPGKPRVPEFVYMTNKELISYYFNVLVLRRISSQTRRGDPVDSDDDRYVDRRRKTRTAERASTTSKYLRLPRI